MRVFRINKRPFGRVLLLVHFINFINLKLHKLAGAFFVNFHLKVLPDLVDDVPHYDLNVVFEYRQIGNQLRLKFLVTLFLALANNVLIGELLFLQKKYVEKRVNFVKGAIAVDLLQDILDA